MNDTGQRFRHKVEIPKGHYLKVREGQRRVHYDVMPGITLAPELLERIANLEVTIQIDHDRSGGYTTNGVIFREIEYTRELVANGR